MTGLFPQLFDKTFATSQQKYFITWHDTEFLINFITLINLEKYIYKIQCISLYSCYVKGLKMSVLISETWYKHLYRKKPT